MLPWEAVTRGNLRHHLAVPGLTSRLSICEVTTGKCRCMPTCHIHVCIHSPYILFQLWEVISLWQGRRVFKLISSTFIFGLTLYRWARLTHSRLVAGASETLSKLRVSAGMSWRGWSWDHLVVGSVDSSPRRRAVGTVTGGTLPHGTAAGRARRRDRPLAVCTARLQMRRKGHDYIKAWNTFHITCPLWGESTSHWWIPITKGKLC